MAPMVFALLVAGTAVVAAETSGQWERCTHGACCNPHNHPTQYCPGRLPCQPCGGSHACQCPSYGPAPTPGPRPTPPTPVPVPTPSPGTPGTVQVASYNLYWWHVSQHHDWHSLFSSVRKHMVEERRPVLIGFQECEDVARVVGHAGLVGYDYYMGGNKPHNNPAPIAWDRQVFQSLSAPQQKVVANDKYGHRLLTFVRLLHRPTGRTVFFANTHGPLGNCGHTVGRLWAESLSAAAESGDAVFITGDFNCPRGTPAMEAVKSVLPQGVDVDVDHIASNSRYVSGGRTSGWPSDHHFVYAAFDIAGGLENATMTTLENATTLDESTTAMEEILV